MGTYTYNVDLMGEINRRNLFLELKKTGTVCETDSYIINKMEFFFILNNLTV